MINAEVEYKSKYSQALTYITKLRAQIGSEYPRRIHELRLSRLPPDDSVQRFPRSRRRAVEPAADVLPRLQASRFRTVFYHTYRLNQIYQRPIHPLGQTYEGVNAVQALDLPQVRQALPRAGLQLVGLAPDAPEDLDGSSARRFRPRAPKPLLPYPLLRQGYKSDMVRWCKLKLNAAGAKLSTNLLVRRQDDRGREGFPDASRACRHRPDRRGHVARAAGGRAAAAGILMTPVRRIRSRACSCSYPHPKERPTPLPVRRRSTCQSSRIRSSRRSARG